MIQKSPAFSFYAKDFLTGTATMTLAERGAYVTLLAHEWDAGGVPGTASERARVLGCTAAKEKAIWLKLGSKFVPHEGVYVNVRLEQERHKQTERRQKLAQNGSKGGSKKAANEKQLPEQQPPQMGGQKSSLAFSSSSSGSGIDTGSSTSRVRGGGLIVGGGEYVRLLETHAYVGAKLRVPKVLHTELMTKSGANADEELRAWYARLDEQLEQDGKGTGDVFVWLRPRHQAFAIEKGWVDAPAVNGQKPKFDGIEAAQERLRAAGRIK